MLKTDWLKVCTEGLCVDKRVVEAAWLQSMAKSYNPATYTAVINSEHFFFPGLGNVLAVKAEKDEQGRMALYAQLEVAAEAVARIQNKRQQFFSIELLNDFPQKGDVYLCGLAMTDTPAAQGMQPTQFSDGRNMERFGSGHVADLDGGAKEEKEPRWFSVFLQRIGLRPGAAASLTTETDMLTEQEKKQLLEEFKAMLPKQPTSEESKAADDAATAKMSAAVKAGVDEALKAALPEAIKTAVDAAVKSVSDKVEALAKQEVPGTKPGPTTDPAGDQTFGGI